MRRINPAIDGRAEDRRTGTSSVIVGTALIGATLVWFGLLFGRSLFDPDEGRYAEIPREMLRGGDWVTPHLNGLIYIEKPPLQYWLTALNFRFLGETEAVARLCPGLAGYLSLVLVYLLGRRLWGSGAGLRAALLTGASTLFVLVGHQLTLDMMLSGWLLVALTCFLLAQSLRDHRAQSRRWMLGCWIAMALAVLTKGLVGVLIPGATLVIYSIWQRDRAVFKTLNLGWGLAVFALIAAPWFVLVSRANPGFLNFFFVREHVQRFLTPIAHRNEAWWFFLAVVAIGVLPWLPLALKTLVRTARGTVPRGQFDAARVLWVFVVFVIAFFSFSDSKLITYVLPIVPALALLCASQTAERDRTSVLLGSLLSFAAAAGVVVFEHAAWGSRKVIAGAATAQTGLTATAGILAVTALTCLALCIFKRERIGLAALCVGWYLAACTVLIAATQTQRVFSAKEIATELRQSAVAAAPVYAVEAYDQSLPFYLQRPVILVHYRDEFAFGLDQDPARGIADLAAFADTWRALSDGYAVMRPQTRDRLTALGLPMHELSGTRNRVVLSRR